MNWTKGRQGTGYLKKLLLGGAFWDLWLIKYPVGTEVPVHTDPVPGKRHYRLNVVLWGEQKYKGDAIFKFGPVVYFRPDITPHSVSTVRRTRYVLSLGWTKVFDE